MLEENINLPIWCFTTQIFLSPSSFCINLIKIMCETNNTTTTLSGWRHLKVSQSNQHSWGGFPPNRLTTSSRNAVMYWFGPSASLTPIVGHLGCGLSCEPPPDTCTHTGDVYELQVAPEGSPGSQRETTEELLREWHHLILTRQRLNHHRSWGYALLYVCVWEVILMSLFASAAAPKVLPAHLKEDESFWSYFCPPACLSPDFLLSKHPLPLLNQGEDFKAMALKIPSLTTWREFH